MYHTLGRLTRPLTHAQWPSIASLYQVLQVAPCVPQNDIVPCPEDCREPSSLPTPTCSRGLLVATLWFKHYHKERQALHAAAFMEYEDRNKKKEYFLTYPPYFHRDSLPNGSWMIHGR